MRAFTPTPLALVAKLVDAPDLGSGDFGRVGSSPIRRTMAIPRTAHTSVRGILSFLWGRQAPPLWGQRPWLLAVAILFLLLLKAQFVEHSFLELRLEEEVEAHAPNLVGGELVGRLRSF